jgi:hypothetical protein
LKEAGKLSLIGRWWLKQQSAYACHWNIKLVYPVVDVSTSHNVNTCCQKHTGVRWNFSVVDIYVYTVAVVSVINLSCDSCLVAKTPQKWHWNKESEVWSCHWKRTKIMNWKYDDICTVHHCTVTAMPS